MLNKTKIETVEDKELDILEFYAKKYIEKMKELKSRDVFRRLGELSDNIRDVYLDCYIQDM